MSTRDFDVRGDAEVARVLRWTPRSLAYDPGHLDPDGLPTLTDWASWGTYAWGVQVVESARSLAFGFDHAVVGAQGIVVVLGRGGTKAVVLQDGVVVREVNRSFSHAEAYEYPMALAEVDGRVVLVHCPDSYSRIDVEDALTGEVLTERESRMGGAFHSRLAVSPDGTKVLSAGWVWSPRNLVEVFDLEEALKNPESLDGTGVLGISAVLDEPTSAAWAQDSSLVVCNEPHEDDTWDPDEARDGLLAGEVGRWDWSLSRWSARHELARSLGDMSVSGDTAVGLLGSIRGVDLRSGREVFEVDFPSGRRAGPFLSRAPQAWAFDSSNRRLAVCSGSVVIEVSY
jgi:hypothetical protein